MPSVFSLVLAELKKLAENQHKPQAKFIRDFLLLAIAGRAGHMTTLSEPVQGSTSLPPGATTETAERLGLQQWWRRGSMNCWISRHLNSDRLDDAELHKQYLARVAPLILRHGRDAVVAWDGSEVVKPWSRPARLKGQQGVTKVRDASASTRAEPRLRLGYPLDVAEVVLPGGNRVPLALELYSRASPDPFTGLPWRSDLASFLAHFDAVLGSFDPQATVVFDRGYPSKAWCEAMDARKVHWVARLPLGDDDGGWKALLDNGVVAGVGTLARYLKPEHTISVPTGKGRERRMLQIGIAATRAQLKAQGSKWGPDRTVVALWIDDSPTPCLLLAHEWLGAEAKHGERVRALYRQRWVVEEAIRLAKDSRGWGGDIEGFQLIKLKAVKRFMRLNLVAAGMVSLVRASDDPACQALVSFAEVQGKRDRKDHRYAISAALADEVARKLAAYWDRRHRRRVPKDEQGVQLTAAQAERRVATAKRALRRAEAAARAATPAK